MKIGIKHISTFLPEKILTNGMLANEFPEWTVEKISKKIGIDQRHVSSEDEFVSDMAIKAAEKLFTEYDIQKSSIDFVILCTQSPDYFFPTTACVIQDKLGLSKKVGAIDINQGCSGYIYGLALSKGLISSGISSNVLLITSEVYTKHLNKTDKSNRAIFGDAATATLITGFNPVFEINEFEFGSDGSGAENLILRRGGMKYLSQLETRSSDLEPSFKDGLYMNGNEIFKFTLEEIPNLVNNILLKNNKQYADISRFVFHQANEYMLNHLRTYLYIPEEKFEINMRLTGNTVSSTIPIALENLIIGKRLDNLELLLVAGFGVGYSWGGTILKYEN